MNRSVLIAVCDFLILSLLSAGSFSKSLSESKTDSLPQGTLIQEDILDSLEMILDFEKQNQAKLKASLKDTESSLDEETEKKNKLEQELQRINEQNMELDTLLKSGKSELSKKASQLSEMDQKIKKIKADSEQINKKLKHEKEKSSTLELSLTSLKENLSDKEEQLEETQNNFSASLKSIESLSQQIASSQEYSKELEKKLVQKEEELTQQLLNREKEIAKLEKLTLLKDNEIERLSEKVQESTLKQYEILEELKTVQNEKTSLEVKTQDMAHSMAKIASDSMELKKKQMPISNNELFQQFLDKKAEISFKASGKWLFASVFFDKKVSIIPIKTKTQSGLLLHFNDSPLDWLHFGKNLKLLSIKLIVKQKEYPLSQSPIHVLKEDPRVVFIEFKDELPSDLQFFKIEDRIFQFDDALLIRTDEEKYGSFKWNYLAEEPHYIAVPTSLKSRIFGSFSPKRGDLVFSRSGKILGIMVSKSTALHLKNINLSETFSPGNPIDHTLHIKNYKKWKKRLTQLLSPTKQS